MSKSKSVPLRITAHLLDGRINSADGLIMFDSILYHAWFAKHAPGVLVGEGSDDWAGYIGLPLVQLPGNRWKASKAIYKCTGKTVESYNKRPDFFGADKTDYLDKETGIICSTNGPYKAYRVPSVVRTVKDGILTFYAVGNREKVEELLSYIPAVGKKNSMGFGMVGRWDVEECAEDYTYMHPKYGLMRPTPVEDVEYPMPYPIMEYAVKPPYWKQKNKRLCYVPVEV